jgi:hypothetical protein
MKKSSTKVRPGIKVWKAKPFTAHYVVIGNGLGRHPHEVLPTLQPSTISRRSCDSSTACRCFVVTEKIACPIAVPCRSYKQVLRHTPTETFGVLERLISHTFLPARKRSDTFGGKT